MRGPRPRGGRQFRFRLPLRGRAPPGVQGFGQSRSDGTGQRAPRLCARAVSAGRGQGQTCPQHAPPEHRADQRAPSLAPRPRPPSPRGPGPPVALTSRPRSPSPQRPSHSVRGALPENSPRAALARREHDSNQSPGPSAPRGPRPVSPQKSQTFTTPEPLTTAQATLTCRQTPRARTLLLCLHTLPNRAGDRLPLLSYQSPAESSLTPPPRPSQPVTSQRAGFVPAPLLPANHRGREHRPTRPLQRAPRATARRLTALLPAACASREGGAKRRPRRCVNPRDWPRGAPRSDSAHPRP